MAGFRDFTMENGRERDFNGGERERTGFHGRERDFTGENGRERESTGENRRERDFTGDNERERESTEETGWSVAVFSYIMDTTRVNIHTLIALNTGKEPRKVNSFDFGRKLAMDLLTPHLYSRELTGVPQHIILKTYLLSSYRRCTLPTPCDEGVRPDTVCGRQSSSPR